MTIKNRIKHLINDFCDKSARSKLKDIDLTWRNRISNQQTEHEKAKDFNLLDMYLETTGFFKK